jgi:hypothetical protein
VSPEHEKSNFPATHLIMENGSAIICWESPAAQKTKTNIKGKQNVIQNMSSIKL